MSNENKMGQNLERYFHTAEAVNNEDPDDGNSWLCSACTLPIFSTPFVSRGKHLLHDGCANLPYKLTGQVLHREGTLVRKTNKTISTEDSFSCSQCKRKCGTVMYECPGSSCGFKLDLLCALQVTIMHRGHDHRLMAITGSASFVCGVCGTQHPGFSALSYLCKGCDFWIHPDCASLPNAVTLNVHPHSLYLTYNLPTPSGARVQSNCTCAVCGGVLHSTGVYLCAKCGYYAHIKCAVSDPHSFKPVLLRDANLAGLLHFPMADDDTSVMPYIMESEEDSSGEVDHRHLHPHPLIFHRQDTDDQSARRRVCNACVQLISPSDPFHMCSECPDFFLHKCCANLPTQIQPRFHEHTLFLFPKARNSSVSGCFFCYICYKQSNGFAYSCTTCDSAIDVVCAMLPPTITHRLHSKSHILYPSLPTSMLFMFAYDCCGNLKGGPAYTCTNCPNFRLHVDCARLPSSIKHKFDDHILTLTTGDHIPKLVEQICEICEDYIKLKPWCYSCRQCDQWFHPDCVRGFSNLKLGGTIKVNCHDCPLALILESSVYGYHCDSCLQVFDPIRSEIPYENQEAAYECSNCYFRIHERCAQKCLLS